MIWWVLNFSIPIEIMYSILTLKFYLFLILILKNPFSSNQNRLSSLIIFKTTHSIFNPFSVWANGHVWRLFCGECICAFGHDDHYRAIRGFAYFQMEMHLAFFCCLFRCRKVLRERHYQSRENSIGKRRLWHLPCQNMRFWWRFDTIYYAKNLSKIFICAPHC